MGFCVGLQTISYMDSVHSMRPFVRVFEGLRDILVLSSTGEYAMIAILALVGKDALVRFLVRSV